MNHAPSDPLASLAGVQRRTMVVLVITQIVGTVGVGVAPSIGILLAEQVTNSEAWAGLARTASTLGAALFGIPLGNLAARRGRRLSLAAGWWIAGLGSAILVVAAQRSLVVPLFVGLLLIGAGAAVSLQARFAATDLAQPHHKGRALSMVVWFGTLGTVIGPNLGAPGKILGAVTGLTVFAAAFLIAAVFLILAGAVVFVALRPDPLLMLAERVGTPTTTRKASLRQRLRAMGAELGGNRPARVAVVAILTGQVVMVAIMTMTPVHIVHHGGDIDVVGITLSIHIAGMFAFSPIVGWLSDRFGPRPAIWAGIAILLASLVIAAAWPDDTAWVMTSLFLLGLGWCFTNVAGSALFTSTVSTDVRASSQGGVDALSNLLGAVAAFGAGPLLAASSFPMLSVLTMVALLPLCVLVARPLPRT
ncbi:MFS transporter [Tessaracoccus sp.]|uniref:MFS transporter n=1 Tax=Tessaracoccus sp. TaxID=1971211 RepID=UPI00260ACA36|nr:MFS transporter [Tessaracoccus sp.]